MILACAAEKGGVGKTTTAVHLSSYLAEQGRRVLLLDLDSQGEAGSILAPHDPGAGPRPGMYELLVHHNRYAGGFVPAERLVIRARPNLDVIPNDPRIAEAEHLIAGARSRERILAQRLAELQYDAVIIDVGPTVNLISLLPLYAATHLLIPVSPGWMAWRGVEGLMARLEAMRSTFGRAPEVLGVLGTMVDTREKLGLELVERLEAAGNSLGTIRRNVKLAEAPALGKTVFEYAPRSYGAQDYRRLGALVNKHIATAPVPQPA